MSSGKTKNGATSSNKARGRKDKMAMNKAEGDAITRNKSQRSRKRSGEFEPDFSGAERDASLTRQKRQKRVPSRKAAVNRTLDPRASREQVTQASEKFREMVAKCQQQMDDASCDLLNKLSSFSTEATEIAILQGQPGNIDKNRPTIYKTGARCLDQARELLEAYKEHNARVQDKRVGVAPGRWEDHITFVSKSLESGLAYGIDLVDALLRPSKEPSLPILDETQAQETEKLGVELFELPPVSKDTWGRAARMMVDGWSEFLSTPSKI